MIDLRMDLEPVVIEGIRRIKQLPSDLADYLSAGVLTVESIREIDQILIDNQWTPPLSEGGINV